MSGFDTSGCQKAFTVSTESWWYDHVAAVRGDLVEEVTFGLYHMDGGTCGEMTMKWRRLGQEVVPQLCVYSDAWNALHSFGLEFIEMLAHHGERYWYRRPQEPMTPTEFRVALTALGFADRTQRVRPGALKGVTESPPWGLVRELERLQKQMLVGSAQDVAAEVETLRRGVAADVWNSAVALAWTKPKPTRAVELAAEECIHEHCRYCEDEEG